MIESCCFSVSFRLVSLLIAADFGVGSEQGMGASYLQVGGEAASPESMYLNMQPPPLSPPFLTPTVPGYGVGAGIPQQAVAPVPYGMQQGMVPMTNGLREVPSIYQTVPVSSEPQPPVGAGLGLPGAVPDDEDEEDTKM